MDNKTIPVKAFMDLNGDVIMVHYDESRKPTYGKYLSNIGAFCTLGNSLTTNRNILFFKKESDNQIYLIKLFIRVRYDEINGVRGVDFFEVSKRCEELDISRRLIKDLVEWEKHGDYTLIESSEEVVVRGSNSRHVAETLYLLRNIENILENTKVDNSYYMFARGLHTWSRGFHTFSRGIKSPHLLWLDKYSL